MNSTDQKRDIIKNNLKYLRQSDKELILKLMHRMIEINQQKAFIARIRRITNERNKLSHLHAMRTVRGINYRYRILDSRRSTGLRNQQAPQERRQQKATVNTEAQL